MQRAAVFNNANELQQSVSFVNRYSLQPGRSGGKIRLQKESAYWGLFHKKYPKLKINFCLNRRFKI